MAVKATGYRKRRKFRRGGKKRNYVSKSVYNVERKGVAIRLSEIFEYTCANDGERTFEARSFRLDDFQGATSYATDYDEFKMMGVTITVVPCGNCVNVNTLEADQCGIPMFFWKVDRNDVQAWSSKGVMMGYNPYKRWLNKPITFKIYPRVLSQYYDSSIYTGYGTEAYRPWIRCNNSDVQHYGLKWALVLPTGMKFLSTEPYRYYLYVTADVLFRGKRA